MTDKRQFSEELGGKRDLDYIRPKGRRLTEYEAVTCYTQPQVGGGGLQVAGELVLRPDLRPIYDLESTRLRCDDWFAYRDPNQMWQRPYYVTQAEAEKAIERATNVARETGAMREEMPADWIQNGILGTYFPFGHYEYGLFRALNMAARESLSDSVNNVLVFNASDKLRHAQAISILGLDLESMLDNFDGTAGRPIWLDDEMWQPLRRLTEQAMVINDWAELIIAVDLAIEPLIGEPMRRLVFTQAASRNSDTIVSTIASTATADWHRNSSAVREFIDLLADTPGGEQNRAIMEEWLHTWRERAGSVAAGLFTMLEATLNEPGLVVRAARAGEAESKRVGVDILEGVAASA